MADEEKKEITQMSCADFSEFKEALKVLRLLDDKIMYKLNTSVPTESFAGEINGEAKCRELYTELLDGFKSRENAIKRCIHEVSNNIKSIKEQREANPDDFDLSKRLRSEQTKLRLMHSELSVEEVLKPGSLKKFNDKCWKSFKPPK
ncbi:coiled-coil domain-containing protein 58-like [Actinia tenebrosa]|uniref:Protein MIX23 n=1 Tax=Actinia tenebrosa TaxID=6105 RepID=A0A6P8HCC2_ACTTE|nr:coiled-coil domain-containing protein 58-like [Actinia tenebrosa]XP_031552738.1 coiled-coil domain-containing protein 58-like [Actinia tenebrosa]